MVQAVAVIGFCGASLLTMGLIAISRYVAIVHPQKKNLLSWKVCGILCSIPWIQITLIMVPAFTGWGRIGWHPASWSCTFDWNYNIWYNLIIVFGTQGVTSIIMLFCYSQIYIVYRNSKKRVAGEKSGPRRGQRKKKFVWPFNLL